MYFSSIMAELVLKNRDLYDELRTQSISLTASSKASSQCLLLYINKQILAANLTITNDFFEEKLKLKIATFCSHLAFKWNRKGINRTNSNFLSKHADWLDLTFNLPSFSEASTSNAEKDLQNVGGSGRSQKIFSECSSRTKRRRTEKLRANTSLEELIAATKTTLYNKGLKSSAQLLGQCIEKSESETVEVSCSTSASKPAKLITPYTPEEALASILNSGMTKDAYVHEMRLGAKQRNVDIYPAYEKVLTAKKLCYPEGVIVTDCGSYKSPLK
ncbi:uncharacterized protein LOC127285771 [Leptopilina boulardi]|uniref:uncharacterized protein LOC127285771 n=1 Tax=Leptopilina boulardi TaxID=63433 RepID=UPI0021F57F98|nr:uncharacterized protein LOC127285771 [Leptopilina boulardi]